MYDNCSLSTSNSLPIGL